MNEYRLPIPPIPVNPFNQHSLLALPVPFDYSGIVLELSPDQLTPEALFEINRE